MDDEPNLTSEWNEQKLFSSIFFNITYNCRNAQRQQRVLDWFAELDTKMSLIMGVCVPEEHKKIVKIRNFLKPFVIKASKNATAENKTNLYEVLFYAESEIDILAHSHMPFLRIPDQIDIADF
jgi:hypothetical protein